MRRLNGCNRLWVVASAGLLILVAIVALGTLPSEGERLLKHIALALMIWGAAAGTLYAIGIAFAWVIAGFRKSQPAERTEATLVAEVPERPDDSHAIREFVIRLGTDEYRVPNLVALREWAAAGRIPPAAQIFDPEADDWQPPNVVFGRHPDPETRRKDLRRGRLWCWLATLLFTSSAVSGVHGSYEILGAALAGILMPWLLVGAVMLVYRFLVRPSRRRSARVFSVTSLVVGILAILSAAGKNLPENRAEREFAAVPAFQEIRKLDWRPTRRCSGQSLRDFAMARK